jgi:hypothetical protein
MRTLVRVRIPSQRTVRCLSLGATFFLILALVSSGTYLLGAAHAASAAPLAVTAPQPINAGKTCVVTATQERLDHAPDLSRDGLSSDSAQYTCLHSAPAPSNYRCYADDHSAVAAITGGVLNVPENLHGKAATDWVADHITTPVTVGSGRGAHVVRVPRYLPTLTNLAAYTYTGTNYTGTATYLVLPVVYLCASPYTGYSYYASLTANLSSFLVRSVITEWYAYGMNRNFARLFAGQYESDASVGLKVDAAHNHAVPYTGWVFVNDGAWAESIRFTDVCQAWSACE